LHVRAGKGVGIRLKKIRFYQDIVIQKHQNVASRCTGANIPRAGGIRPSFADQIDRAFACPPLKNRLRFWIVPDRLIDNDNLMRFVGLV
jgi:hypothetical protein